MRFGEFLRQRRLEKNLSLSKVSDASGASIALLSRLETGSRFPASYSFYLEPLAEVLDINPIEFAVRSKHARRDLSEEAIKSLISIEKNIRAGVL